MDASPEEIRRLRGSATRAAFAAAVGVSPLTVYRWELPRDRNDARTPRGTSLAKLGALAAQSGKRDHESASLRHSKDELAALWPFVEQTLSGDVWAASTGLVERMAREAPSTPDGRALAAVGLALAQIFGHGDGRAALAALASAVAAADDGALDRTVAAWVLATAAFIHSFPDGSLLDIGKVHAYGARAEALAPPGAADDVILLGRMAAVQVATWVADAELVTRALARIEPELGRPMPPLIALMAEECRGLGLLLSGQTATATRVFESLAAAAEARQAPLFWARAVGFLAVRRLDDLVPPEEVLAMVERARERARAARLAPGHHTMLLARASAEARFRMGDVDGARGVLAELDAVDEAQAFPSFAALPTRIHIEYLTGNVEALREISARLGSTKIEVLRSVAAAYAAYADAMRGLAGDETPEDTARAFTRAGMLARRWAFLDREVTLSRVLAHLLARDFAEAELALRRATRAGEVATTAWTSAQLLRLEGTALAGHGDWPRARALLNAASATLERGGDRPRAAITRHVRLALGAAFDDPEATREALASSVARLAELGLPAPAALDVGLTIVRERRGERVVASPSGAADVESLLVPFQRLAVRGASTAFLERELLSVAERLLGGEARLTEVHDLGLAEPSPTDGTLSAEFNDGSGRRLRLSVRGPATPTSHALLALLTLHASLAMECAALRGDVAPGVEAAPPERDPGGFVAASPALRALKGELARLASSRATVIVTGESGSGKEVVARTLHQLSERRAGPFVAFNCAAIPHELFEGELFGYRRGAFTGATENHPGVIRSASGGTLFMDEIGELPLELQAKLLRFLDRNEVLPLGERRPIRVDARVVAATHRDLVELVRRGRFREDLYYRLQVVPLRVPPLRERPEDIVALARHFVIDLTPKGTPPTLAPDALARLTQHRWPGNVRELRNVIERALAYSPRPTILRAEHLAIDGR